MADISSSTLFHPVTIIIKGSFVGIISILIFLIGIVIAPLRLTIAPTHTSGSLRSCQQNQAAAPNATQPTTSKRSPLIMLIMKIDRLMKPKSPANTVRKRLPAKPMTLARVLDTIALI